MQKDQATTPAPAPATDPGFKLPAAPGPAPVATGARMLKQVAMPLFGSVPFWALFTLPPPCQFMLPSKARNSLLVLFQTEPSSTSGLG